MKGKLTVYDKCLSCVFQLKGKKKKKTKHVQIAKSFVFYINKHIRDKEMFDIHESFFFFTFV